MKTAVVRRNRAGSAMLEFSIFGIPIIFVLISVFELSRGMWVYDTLAYATKDTARFAAVHGQLCVGSSAACALTIAQVAGRLQYAGVGLLPSQLNATFQTTTQTIACNPLQSCLANTACFPTAADCSATLDSGAIQGQPVTVSAVYPFQSAISMFWPGTGKGMVFGTFNLPAKAQERIQF
jgi:Flp pilus assembly protein TadG